MRDTTTTAERELGARLDELLGELEDNREQGEADLREKIASGEVEAGPEARKIEAKLWERQRDRAAELREAWEPLEQIAFEGAELSVELLASLRDFLERSVDALVDAHPELRSFAGDWAKPTGQRIWRIERPQPMPRQRDPHSPSFQVDDARRITEPLDPTETYEYGRDVEPPVHDTSPPRYASPTPAPLAPSTVIDAAVTRIVQGWHPVTRGEFLLMVGPPAVYFGFLAVTAAMFRLGYSPENPFDRWNWAFPVFLGLAVYSFVMPAFMRWRVQWNGLRPQLVRWEEERQDAYVRVDGKGVSLGPTRLEFDGCRVKLQRVRAGGRFSWLFTMRVGRIELTLIADANETRWASGSAEVIDNVPPRAWKLSEETLLAIAQRAGKQP